MFPQDRTAELSKLCVKDNFRGGTVSLGLLKKAFEYSEKERIKYWLMGTTQKLATLFENRLGVSLTSLPVGPPGPKHLKERGIVGRKYFQTHQVRPYILKLEKIKKT